MAATEFKLLIYEKRGRVAEITLNRPSQLNALSIELYQELGDAIEVAGSDPDLRVVTITGSGRAFSTGGDLKQGDKINRDAPEVFAEVSKRMLSGILRSDLIVVAKVNGITQAGGLLVVAACDLVIASDQATFKSPEGLVGLYEPYSHALLAPLIGVRHTKHLLLTSETIDAAEAKRIGLVNKVVPHDELETETNKMVDRILASGPVALRMFKRMLNQQIEEFDASIVVEALGSEEGLEGTAAFTEKRKPKWRE